MTIRCHESLHSVLKFYVHYNCSHICSLTFGRNLGPLHTVHIFVFKCWFRMLRVVAEFGRRKGKSFLCSNVDLECYELWRNLEKKRKVIFCVQMLIRMLRVVGEFGRRKESHVDSQNKPKNKHKQKDWTGYIPIIKLKKRIYIFHTSSSCLSRTYMFTIWLLVAELLQNI